MPDLYQSPLTNPLQGALVPQSTTLTDGATIALDASLGDHFIVTLGGNRTLAAPTNPKGGQRLTLIVKQDGTGSRTLTFDAAYIFDHTAALNSSASAQTTYVFVCDSAGKARCVTVSTDVGAGSLLTGSATILNGQSSITASVGTAYNGKPVFLQLKTPTGAISASVIPAIVGVVAAGTLTISTVDKANSAVTVGSDQVIYYMIDGR